MPLTITITIPDDHAPRAARTACRSTGHDPDNCPAPQACIGDYAIRRTVQEIGQSERQEAEEAAAAAAQPLDTSGWTVELGGTEPDPAAS